MNSKTLVIHPKDVTTDFLTSLYSDNKDWTVINDNPSRKYLTEQIKLHDRIIMLGHGTEHGLIGFKRLVIDSNWVYLLRQKECVFVWCNADVFVKKYDLTGFYTGMIISEYDEALMYCLHNFNGKDIEESNTLFSDSLKNCIKDSNMLDHMKANYHSTENPVIMFNQDNLYKR